MSNVEIQTQYLHVNVSTALQTQTPHSSTLSFLEITIRIVGDCLAERGGKSGQQARPQGCCSTLLLFAYPAFFCHAICGYSHGRFGLG